MNLNQSGEVWATSRTSRETWGGDVNIDSHMDKRPELQNASLLKLNDLHHWGIKMCFKLKFQFFCRDFPNKLSSQDLSRRVLEKFQLQFIVRTTGSAAAPLDSCQCCQISAAPDRLHMLPASRPVSQLCSSSSSFFPHYSVCLCLLSEDVAGKWD